ncbi:uncharacterized protein TRIVIDRAFT_78067 [Trichoderma virens Gv29-8]|uniref:Uncharacterized protein n=1 Tax=Hypocrea virens (strain Gv29-8 / FGSC 10586) TaxID=413071 RepID=G9N1U3_HYPVG|nr:uncharacterized protein TRIVIDRAFT_78067 [Trichoderma virens Gv29-8]EHK19060.1 hypothetical protein TRIVIDRAFT_78067 [Trichoderma virens Gv29-8]UKZ49488.1 hypothetical protein TrVGV298_003735 [Trichoderma virens]
MVRFEIFDARELLSFPGGDNSTDTVFGGIHFNLTTLEHWNYTYYSNGTLSNNSRCYLTYEPYQPKLLISNGTFINATKCYSAVDPIGVRGYVGIGFAAVYAIGLMLTLTALAKHGRLYLPKEKRFYPIGRRWQWYWACFVCACALISLFTNIDIDRYHVVELPIIVTSFFWFLICQGTIALVWESVRHWGSWQERQFIDPNPFVYRTDDRRSKVEFYLPLWFYFWTWMNFFLVVPRSWSFVEMQRSPEQTLAKAIPTATGARFKAGAFCLVIAWFTIVFSLRHSIYHYKPRNRGVFNRTLGLVRAIPLRFVLTIPLAGALVAYQTLISFNWTFSVMRYGGVVPVIFAWGYGPSLLIIFVQVAYGFASPNEDKALLAQRRQRGDLIDRELGIVKKPAWWKRVRGDHLLSMRDKISKNVNEVGGKRGLRARFEDEAEREQGDPTTTRNDGIEMNNMSQKNNPRVDRAGVANLNSTEPRRYDGKSERRHNERIVESFAGVLFPNNPSHADAERARRIAEISQDGPPPYRDEERGRSSRQDGANNGQRNGSADTTNSIAAPPQQVRSMLDV